MRVVTTLRAPTTPSMLGPIIFLDKRFYVVLYILTCLTYFSKTNFTPIRGFVQRYFCTSSGPELRLIMQLRLSNLFSNLQVVILFT